jgi:dUTPase
MQLISKGMYEALYRPQGTLIIDPFDESLFCASFCYFRLGGLGAEEGVLPLTEQIELRKREVRRVFTLETFKLSGAVLGLLGPCSELLLKGLVLHNSPTIDPGFEGSLEMLLENNTDQGLNVRPGTKIGKVVFFDVRDSLLDLHQYVDTERKKAAWVARRQAGDKILEAAAWIEKMIDSEAPKDT